MPPRRGLSSVGVAILRFMNRGRLALPLLLFVALPGWLEAASSRETGTSEVTLLVGGIAGAGGHRNLGAGLGYTVGRGIILGFEATHSPLGGDVYGDEPQLRGAVLRETAGGGLTDLNLNLHFQLGSPYAKSQPYFAGGFGWVRASTTATFDHPGGPTIRKDTSTHRLANFGAGLRYPLTERIGVRPEVRVYVGDDAFVRFSAGVFYQFPPY
jgi:hypothetical protein